MKDYMSVNKKALEYRNTYELDKFAECFHEKVEFIILDDNKTVATGRDELVRMIKDKPESEKIRWEIIESIPVNSKVFTHEASVHENGDKEDYMFIYEYEDGLIRRVWLTNK